MNIALWIAQILLALMFLMGGIMKTFQYEKVSASMPWAKDASRGFVLLIGLSELLAAIGFIVPTATDILPWLAGVAAIGIAVIMVLAIGVHARRSENQAVVMNVVLLAIAVFVAIGRLGS
ncbi:DoxX family protein [Paenibacillus sp. CF384]|uniref:DoxX family protein n=1 Tax=Paenibacillus sp. CF384 TaxID=1884382 RepID=UPI00089AA709|nr:DoxX family protein [Paenibacillus sp. CF384]SDY00480.1 DoxX-like family protein [Paenibacillus sp. CF384]